MRKTFAAIAAAGALLAGIAMASPALAQARTITLLCSPGTNGGTLVNGVCVLPAAAAGQPYEGFLLTSNGAVDTFTITKGPAAGLSMPATYGADGTIVGGTPTAGTFTFSVHVTVRASTPSANGTYSIAVGPAPPLAITFPAPAAAPGRSARPTSELLHSGGSAVHLDGGGRPAPARRGADR